MAELRASMPGARNQSNTSTSGKHTGGKPSTEKVSVKVYDPLNEQKLLSCSAGLGVTIQQIIRTIKTENVEILYHGQIVPPSATLLSIGYDPNIPLFAYVKGSSNHNPSLPVKDIDEGAYLQRLRDTLSPDRGLPAITFPDGFDEAMKILFWNACGRNLETVRARLASLG